VVIAAADAATASVRAPSIETAQTATRPQNRQAEWPFAEVSRRKVGGGAKTTPADEIRWRGTLRGRTIEITSRPRTCDPSASFHVHANARIEYMIEHAQFVDLLVHEQLDACEREELRSLAQQFDQRPIVVRCQGELVRGVGRSKATPKSPCTRDTNQSLLDDAFAGV
jgi:hypothetical protein